MLMRFQIKIRTSFKTQIPLPDLYMLIIFLHNNKGAVWNLKVSKKAMFLKKIKM